MPSLFVNTAKMCFWRCSQTRKNENTTKNDERQANHVHFCSFAREHTDSGVRTKMSVNAPKNGGGFREHKFHWGGRSSRPTDRPTRVCTSSRRWCEYHRPVVLFVRFGSGAQPRAKHRGRFAHCRYVTARAWARARSGAAAVLKFSFFSRNCAPPPHPTTNLSRRWLWVAVRKTRLVLAEIASARN